MEWKSDGETGADGAGDTNGKTGSEWEEDEEG